MSKIITFQENNVWKRFPGSEQLTPRLIIKYIEQGIWTNDDLTKENLKLADEFLVPEGKMIVGDEYFNEDGTQQFYDVADIPQSVPSIITPLQARKALRSLGLYEQVNSYIQSLSEEEQEEWEYAIQIERNNHIIVNGANYLGLSEEQVDSLFILGSTL